MAGLIARLLGGKPQQGPAEPEQGIGGYTAGTGPSGQDGFPGSTKQTRTFRTPQYTPRTAKINSDTSGGFEQGLSSETTERQASYRGDVPGAGTRNPRATSLVETPRTEMSVIVQDVPGTLLGGPMLKTGPGNNTSGAHALSKAQAAGGHSMLDTQTPWAKANVHISGDVPGAQNVRNEIAQRYKNPAGIMHTYKSAPRADTAPVNPGGWATDGNVHPERVVQEVTVPNRMVFPNDGANLSWSVLREMPYGGRGNGARGADLNGQRRYATGQEDQFWNAGQGDYGIRRQRGNKSPVAFQTPAPWSANVYATTSDIGTVQDPNQQPSQQPNAVYVSPSPSRRGNGTQRRVV